MIIIIVLINRISPQVFYKYTKRRAAYSKINIMRNNNIIVVVFTCSVEYRAKPPYEILKRVNEQI